jgi:hypothetical protein
MEKMAPFSKHACSKSSAFHVLIASAIFFSSGGTPIHI